MSTLSFPLIWPWILGVLAGSLLLSGLDDLVPSLICLWHKLFRRANISSDRPATLTDSPPERTIAIFVPCWQESAVIERMVRHNMASLRYRNFDFFLGVYPNDEATVEAVNRLAATFTTVHPAVCPHPGPTSKADCLNWIYQRMLLFEEEQGFEFDTVVMHDAEDMIDPQELSLIDRERASYDMIQVPVLPLATPMREVTHGIYCDDFAEYQTIDMPARQLSGSFIPSNGVGTAFARKILERLAQERGNRVFEPTSLTEDYECGVAIHRLGFKQKFAPVQIHRGHILATREYFPRRFWSAIRQRTRWVMGISLQSWERNGWNGDWLTRYWFWRDRKALLANPISLLTNIASTYGYIDWVLSHMQHRPWALAVSNHFVIALCGLTFALQCLRIAVRMACVARIFGLLFALGVPIRSFYSNLINCLATCRATYGYVRARILGLPLAWLKTEHAYPNPEALRFYRRELPDVLVGASYIDEETMSWAQANMTPGMDVGEFLLHQGLITDECLCEAMSLQSGLPAGHIDPRRVNLLIARTLPAHIEQRYGVVPFGLQGGRLELAGPRVPSPNLYEELKKFTRLAVDFHLVTQRNYDQLRGLL